MFDEGDGEVEHGIIVDTDSDGRFPVYILADERGFATKIEIELR